MLVPGDDLVGGVSDRLIIEAPACKRQPGSGARRKRNVVALPRVRLHVLDLPLCVIAEQWVVNVSGSRIDLRMGERSRRPRQSIYEVPALRALPTCQRFADQAVVDVGRSTWHPSARGREQRDVRVAYDPAAADCDGCPPLRSLGITCLPSRSIVCITFSCGTAPTCTSISSRSTPADS